MLENAIVTPRQVIDRDAATNVALALKRARQADESSLKVFDSITDYGLRCNSMVCRIRMTGIAGNKKRLRPIASGA